MCRDDHVQALKRRCIKTTKKVRSHRNVEKWSFLIEFHIVCVLALLFVYCLQCNTFNCLAHLSPFHLKVNPPHSHFLMARGGYSLPELYGIALRDSVLIIDTSTYHRAYLKYCIWTTHNFLVCCSHIQALKNGEVS